ncbi:homeodomain-interacting protein kinase 1-like [Epinephelus moara]|uniref:homeodomain-interacting protein kinase 1-like n=1 Tax=Epinephelus moara TaxID=300413 RepID=UPI00214E34FD|nr:homeodomain-interacting protein kinase 1-like [Epinephelus moara]
MSATAPAQADQVAMGDWLSSSSSNYLVLSFLGQGTFGKVAKCMRMHDKRTVAIKMMTNRGSLVRQAEEEVVNLLKLKSLDSNQSNIVRFYGVFTCQGHICLEFEALDKSLFDFMEEKEFQPLLLKEIRPIVQQIAVALEYLRAAGIIHADLKLENVMLVDHAHEPYRIKVIDFGLACHVSSTMLGSYIQTRYYRSPEIILGLPFTEAVDMWSLGCMAAEMYHGDPLYPGGSEYNMMRYMVETQGQPPDNLLTLGLKTDHFFRSQRGQKKPTTRLFELKTPEQYHRETGHLSVETRRRKLESLYDLIVQVTNPESPADKVAVRSDELIFVDMLDKMLELDAASRITPRLVLEHQFVSMDHLVCMYRDSSHVKSCFLLMDFCRNNTPASDSGELESRSLQQDYARTSQPLRQNISPFAERNYLSQAGYISPHPCTQTSGMKRKAYDDDGSEDHPSKKSKPGWYRGKNNCPATSSSTLYASTNIQARSAAVRNPPAQPLNQSVNSHSSKSSQAKSSIGSGVKRKADGDDDDHHHTVSDRYIRSHDDSRRCRRDHTRTSSQSCNSPRVKRKRSHGDNYDSERSDHESKRVKKSSAAPSTCSSSSSCTQTLHVRPNRRIIPPEHHCQRAHDSSSTWTESRARSGLNDERRTGEGGRERGGQEEDEDRWRRRKERRREERRRRRRRRRRGGQTTSVKTRDH